MTRYSLTAAAQQDLVAIRDYYIDRAGPRISRQLLTELVQGFRFLACNPASGHRREDLAESRPILFWPVRDFLILYRPSTKPLQILGVFHGSRDLASIIPRQGL